jgi:hypothetical protein
MKISIVFMLFVVLALSLCGCKRELVAPPVHNPYVVSIQATPTNVSKGGATSIYCVAVDPDQNKLTFTWSASAGKFYADTTFAGETSIGNPIIWKAPDNAGTFTIDVAIDDGTGGTAGTSITVAVGKYKLLEVLGQGTLEQPMGVYVEEASGKVWVADAGNNKVWIYDDPDWTGFSFAGIDTAIDTTYTIDSLGDTTSVTIDTTQDTLAFDTPMAVYLDAGLIYVLDSGRDLVHKFASPSPAGYDTSFPMSGITTIPPTGMVVTGGFVYAACGNRGIRKRDVATGTEVDFNQEARQARSIALSGVDRFWVTIDGGALNSYIKEYDPSLDVTKSAQDSLFRPWGIAVGPTGNVFVSQDGDTSNPKAQIAEFTSDGVFVDRWGDTGAGKEQFDSPAGMWVTDDNKIYVCDRGNGVVKVFGPN